MKLNGRLTAFSFVAVAVLAFVTVSPAQNPRLSPQGPGALPDGLKRLQSLRFEPSLINPNGKTYTPGDAVVFAPPIGKGLGPWVVILENGANKRRWAVPLRDTPALTSWAVGRLASRTSKSAPRRYPTFIVPQIPQGVYEAWHQSESFEGARIRVTVQPKLTITGPDQIYSGETFTVFVRMAGPSQKPDSHTRKLGRVDFQRLTKVDSALQPVTVPVGIRSSNPASVAFTPGQPHVQNLGPLGGIRYRMQSVRPGDATLTVEAGGFGPATLDIKVLRPGESPSGNTSGPFDVVVLGDSIAWGQGLREADKYYSRVKSWLEPVVSPRPVRLHVLAHSGATITIADADEDEKYRKAPLWGEVPLSYPSVLTQLRMTDDRITPNDADLVLVAAGMNDVHVMTVLVPNPFDAQFDAIKDRCREFCRDAMTDLLVRTGRKFTRAPIVVTNYFPLVSNSTPPDSAVQMAAMILDAFTGGELKASLIVLGAGLIRDQIARQSEVFDAESTSRLLTAVSRANEQLGSSRALFAEVTGIGAQHAYAAPNTRLWLGLNDPLAGDRARDGAQYIPIAPPVLFASMGHPNVRGARAYADAIIARLETIRSRLAPR